MGHHLDAVASVVITLVLIWLHTHGRQLPFLGVVLDFVVGKGTVSASGTPVIDGLQGLLAELKKRIPHPDDVKPITQEFAAVVGPDGRVTLQPK